MVPRYSFIVPIYNDSELAESFGIEFEKVFVEMVGHEDLDGHVELVFINDGSGPGHAETLDNLVERFPFVRIIHLSRNFGQHRALSCGYAHARGEFVGMLNVDQQDPPREIPKLLAEIEAGNADIVFGLRTNQDRPFLERFGSRVFNWVLNKLTGSDSPLDVATVRVMNRTFLDAYNGLSERSRYLPGLESWLGFRRAFVPVDDQARQSGTSSYTLRKRLAMAVESIIGFSDIPLRMISKVGFVIASIGFGLSGLLIFQRLFTTTFLPGFVPTVAGIMIVGGTQIVVIGIASLYIGRILGEVQGRPVFVIQRMTNCD